MKWPPPYRVTVIVIAAELAIACLVGLIVRALAS